MASLTTHLRRPDDHGRLAFHPDCPVCRGERLAGALPRQGLVGRRAEAVLAAGVLAVTSATPAAALAAIPDEEHEGTVAPEQVVSATPGDPDFEPGGEPTDLPSVAPSVQPAEDPVEDPAAVEPELPTPEDPPAVDPIAEQQVEPPASDPLPAPQAAPTPAVTPPSVPVADTPEAPDTDATEPPRADERDMGRNGRPRTRVIASGTPRAAPDAVYVPVITTAPPTVQPEAPTVAGSANRGQAPQRGDRFHHVQRGESLWSIASDLVGDAASPARIAREVNRLWELNSARIGTGDPDLLMAETRLVLR